MSDRQKCEYPLVRNWHTWTCSANATIERDGHWFCELHDPVVAEERKERLKRELSVAIDEQRDLFESAARNAFNGILPTDHERDKHAKLDETVRRLSKELGHE